jgi:hypothetical protein
MPARLELLVSDEDEWGSDEASDVEDGDWLATIEAKAKERIEQELSDGYVDQVERAHSEGIGLDRLSAEEWLELMRARDGGSVDEGGLSPAVREVLQRSREVEQAEARLRGDDEPIEPAFDVNMDDETFRKLLSKRPGVGSFGEDF